MNGRGKKLISHFVECDRCTHWGNYPKSKLIKIRWAAFDDYFRLLITDLFRTIFPYLVDLEVVVGGTSIQVIFFFRWNYSKILPHPLAFELSNDLKIIEHQLLCDHSLCNTESKSILLTKVYCFWRRLWLGNWYLPANPISVRLGYVYKIFQRTKFSIAFSLNNNFFDCF